MKKRTGFTLAEVLITLTVIGVVAAITLPAINSSTGAARTRSLLKKGMSTLNNAVMMNVANNEWSFADLEGGTPGDSDATLKSQDAQNDRTISGMLNSALVGETNQGVAVYKGEYTGNDKYLIDSAPMGAIGGSAAWMVTYQLADGIVIGVNRLAANCNEDKRMNNAEDYKNFCRGFIDINGNKGPNQVITCQTGTTMYIDKEDDANYNSCTVANNPNADIFPVVFYDSTVELASNAAKAFFNN